MVNQRNRERTLFYRRATWIKDCKHTLEYYLRQVHQRLNTTKSRAFESGEYEIQCLYFEDKNEEGLFFHVSTCIPDQEASLVPKASQMANGDTTTKRPPEGKDYMEGDVFFAVNGNNIVILPNKCRESVATAYIQHVLENTIKGYQIEAVTDLDTLKIIKEEGIKNISFNTCLYSATFDYGKSKKSKSIIEKIKQYLLIAFGEEHDKKTLKELENINVKIALSYNDKSDFFSILDFEAQDLLNDEDGFVIVTKKGSKITSEQVKINRKDSFKPFGQSISRNHAFDSIRQYMNELRKKGAFEQ